MIVAIAKLIIWCLFEKNRSPWHLQKEKRGKKKVKSCPTGNADKTTKLIEEQCIENTDLDQNSITIQWVIEEMNRALDPHSKNKR